MILLPSLEAVEIIAVGVESHTESHNKKHNYKQLILKCHSALIQLEGRMGCAKKEVRRGI